ncbi:MAG: SNAP receptor [Trizodia sp. TS-e1964]|nr:MAG: SNAP receptor [Trizodia sp. TS-e1964]
MVRSTQICRLDGLMLVASVDDEQAEAELSEPKGQVRQIFRRLNQNSEPQASIESGQYTFHYIIQESICFLTICDRSYPRKLAFTYLSDLATEFTTTYSSSVYHSATLRPYYFGEFDTFIQRTKKTYQDSRASNNLEKLNHELRDVTKVMTKNIEDLLYRGDSLERMGEMSGRLREDSQKYRKAAVRINWELLLKQYGPVGVRISSNPLLVEECRAFAFATVSKPGVKGFSCANSNAGDWTAHKKHPSSSLDFQKAPLSKEIITEIPKADSDAVIHRTQQTMGKPDLVFGNF